MFIALQIKLNYKNEKCQSSKFNGKSAVWKGLKTKKTKKSNFTLITFLTCFRVSSLNILKVLVKISSEIHILKSQGDESAMR